MNQIQPADASSSNLPWLAMLCIATLLTACGGGGGDDPAQAPAPPSPGLPTIAAAVSLEDNHQVGVRNPAWPDGNTSAGGQGSPVQGIPCGDPVETFHIHSHLSIFVNGQAQSIPANVGIVQTSPTTDCHYYIHTHDLSGKIHIEGPAPGTFTLGQLFAIWGQPLSMTNIAGITGLPVTVYITENGTVTPFSGDPATVTFASHRHIAIQIGSPIAQVPFFTWTAS